MKAPLGRFYERTHACPCGSGRIASWYIDEKQEPVRACERCRAALLTRLLAASLQERFGSDASDETVVAFLTAHGCRFIDDIADATRSQSPETILTRYPLRPERFVVVPIGLAEQVLLGCGALLGPDFVGFHGALDSAMSARNASRGLP